MTAQFIQQTKMRNVLLQALFFIHACTCFVHPPPPPLIRSSPLNRRVALYISSNSLAEPELSGFALVARSFRQLFSREDSARLGQIQLSKDRLFAQVQQNQGRDSRLQVEETLEELIKLQGVEIIRDEQLYGTWKLIWSSQTADVNPFQTPSKVLGGDCFQVLFKGRAENVVVWPALNNLTLRGGASSERIGPARFALTIDSFSLEMGSLRLPLLQLTSQAPALVVRDAPSVREGSQLVSVADGRGKARVLNQRTGWLEVLYADNGGLRVSRADTGLLYVHQRLPPPGRSS